MAHSAVFTDGNQIGAIISLDVTMIDRSYFLAMRELISIRSRIPVENQDKIIAWVELYKRYLCTDNPIISSKIKEMHEEHAIIWKKQKEIGK